MEYKQGKLSIYNMDCMDLMKGYPDKFFDLAIVDPPYGININHNIGRRKGQKSSNHKKVNWDNKSPEKIYFDELIRISKNQIIWGANHFISKLPYDSSCWLIWDKLFSNEVSFSDCELAWTSFNSVVKRFKMSSNQLNRIHPTQKPIALYTWILSKYAKPSFKILDTHLGSGSSAIATHYFGAEFVASELDSHYFKASIERIKKETSQLSLFEVS